MRRSISCVNLDSPTAAAAAAAATTAAAVSSVGGGGGGYVDDNDVWGARLACLDCVLHLVAGLTLNDWLVGIKHTENSFLVRIYLNSNEKLSMGIITYYDLMLCLPATNMHACKITADAKDEDLRRIARRSLPANSNPELIAYLVGTHRACCSSCCCWWWC